MKLRTLFSLLFFLLTLPLALADGVVDKFLASPAIRPQSVAVLITDLSNGETVVSYNESKPLIPASIMKTVTIASLLEESGSDYIYHTKVYTDGHIRDGHLEGNLVVVGSGDPSLNASCEPRSSDILVEIRDALRKKRCEKHRRQIDNRLSGVRWTSLSSDMGIRRPRAILRHRLSWT